jgi:hypothetical protein
MPVSRRQFIASTASVAAGVGAATEQVSSQAARPTAPAGAAPGPDPLGVRPDFPIVRGRTWLNSAYITPVPEQVVAAGRAFVDSKAVRPIPLGEMLEDRRGARAVRTAHQRRTRRDRLPFSTSEGGTSSPAPST